MIVPQHHRGLVRSSWSQTRRCPAAHALPPFAIVLGRQSRAELLVFTRSPENIPAMRKTFSSGLSIPLVASVRKPSKYCLPSNSNDQLSMPIRFTFYCAARSASAFIAAAVYVGYTSAIAVAVGRVLLGRAGSAALRIGLRQDDRQVVVLRRRSHRAESAGRRVDLIAQAHADVAGFASQNRASGPWDGRTQSPAGSARRSTRSCRVRSG